MIRRKAASGPPSDAQRPDVAVHYMYMVWSLIIQTLTFRAAVLVVDYLILAVVLQRPVEAGFITIVRHGLHTFMYWGHEVAWIHWRLGHATTLTVFRQHTIRKTISFRIISLAADLVLLGILTQSIWASSLGAVLIGISNSIFFYFHDRWWQAWRTRHTEGINVLNEH